MKRMCMAHGCMREATRDLTTHPLCTRCKNLSIDIERRWGARKHVDGTHVRKEVLGGTNS